jgi:hypothetical protein
MPQCWPGEVAEGVEVAGETSIYRRWSWNPNWGACVDDHVAGKRDGQSFDPALCQPIWTLLVGLESLPPLGVRDVCMLRT